MEGQHGQLGSDALRVPRLVGPIRALFPHFCCGCGLEGTVLCEPCRYEAHAPLKGLFVCPGCGAGTPAGTRCGRRACQGPLDGLAAMAPYGHRVFGRLVRLYKYGRVQEAGAALAAAFERFLDGHRPFFGAWMPATVVRVPLHFLRSASRGFDQTAPFAASFARTFRTRQQQPLLRKRFRWSPQAALEDPGKRKRNAEGSVVLADGADVPPTCVLIDDVVTTGATLEACAAALKKGGARRVVAVALLKG